MNLMKNLFAVLLLTLTCTAQAATPSPTTTEKGKNTMVKFDTNLGSFTLQLDAEKAPLTVKNFLDYVNSGFYTNTIFHRVMDGFMIQGGGFEPGMKQKPTNAPVANEANNGLKNDNYTVAMARTNDPNSATAQFFVNVTNNAFLYRADCTRLGLLRIR
jgi:peptidyl-prolyl cis-trans isomerase B (cyclophilin B)